MKWQEGHDEKLETEMEMEKIVIDYTCAIDTEKTCYRGRI